MSNYTRPGVQVIQLYQNTAPALVVPSLPCIINGPAYAVVALENVGNYTGSLTAYPYLSLPAGSIVDLNAYDPDVLVQYPVTITLAHAVIVLLPIETSGISTLNSNLFQDTTTVNAFEGAAIGDTLVITGGADAGSYLITTVYSTNYTKVTINAELTATATGVSYQVQRTLTSLNIPTTTAGVVVDQTSVTLPAGLTYQIGMSTPMPIISGNVELSYRAFRIDVAGVKDYEVFADLEAQFGVGNIRPENPLAYGINIAMSNTTTDVGGLALTVDYLTDEVVAYTKALNVLKAAKLQNEDVYSLIPLTQSPVVHQLFDAHVTTYSAPAKKRERIAFINRQLVTTTDITATATTTTTEPYNVTPARLSVGISGDISWGSSVYMDTTTPGAFTGVFAGDILRISDGHADDGDHIILSVDSTSRVTLTVPLTLVTSTGNYQIVRNDGLWADGVTFYDSNAKFLTSNVLAGQYLNVTSGIGIGTDYLKGRNLIGTVNSQKKLTLASAVLGAPYTTVVYKVDRDYTLDEQALYIASYATAFANRRLFLVWPDICQTPVGAQVMNLPGYYLCCALGGMVAGLPPHQGFTNLTLTGFTGVLHAGTYFDQDYLDEMAGGGVMICDQDLPTLPLYVRHQLSTDRSSITFQELSITKNVDNMAKLVRSIFAKYIGKFNITDTLISELKKIGSNTITYLKESTRQPNIGCQLRDGTLLYLRESQTQADTLESQWNLSVPYPLNYLIITFFI